MREIFVAITTISLILLGVSSRRTHTKANPPSELEVYFWRNIGEYWIQEVLSGIHFVDGVLSREDFRMMVYSEVVPVLQPSDEDIEKVFLATDSNSDGFLNAAEISAAYEKSTIGPKNQKKISSRAKNPAAPAKSASFVISKISNIRNTHSG
jgi:hypothetical protein